MEWARALVCACVGLFWISNANGVKPRMMEQMMEQREVDMDEFMRAVVQQEIRVSVEVEPDEELRERGPPAFGPRSFARVPPSLQYPVQFPPGRPTPENLQAICLHGGQRPRYPDTYFPGSGFGQLRRRASAVNLAESLFSECCANNQTQGLNLTLCCVGQAWKQMVATFCEEDTSVKDRVYSCCKTQGAAKLTCFQDDAPNASYLPTEEIPVSPIPVESSFLFDPNACLTSGEEGTPQRSLLTPHSSRGRTRPTVSAYNLSISFPPARPTANNIASVCMYQKVRPLYDLQCIPHKGFGWLVHQTKAINRMEKGFKRCCKSQQNVLQCAVQRWSEEMDRFCMHKKTTHHCCEKEEGRERYDCFQRSAPGTANDVDLTTTSTSAEQDASLSQICETHKLIKKKHLAGLPIQNFVKQCCHLSSNQRTSCILQKIRGKNICSARRAPFVAKCCTRSVDTSQCITKILTNAISKQIRIRLRKKKCPIAYNSTQ